MIEMMTAQAKELVSWLVHNKAYIRHLKIFAKSHEEHRYYHVEQYQYLVVSSSVYGRTTYTTLPKIYFLVVPCTISTTYG